MYDYLLRRAGKSTRDINDFDPSLLLGDVNDSPELAEAPLVIQDEITFPYISGAAFVEAALRRWNGWSDFHRVFENPPASTQQILHPDLYFRGTKPAQLDLTPVMKTVPRGWKKLDENVMGEFATSEILKQFLGKERAEEIAPLWAGDRYVIYQRESGDQTLLVMRFKFASEAGATRLFGAYRSLLDKKDGTRTAVSRRQNFYSFNTPDNGGAFLRCHEDECLIAEGTTADVFDAMTKAVHWPPAGPATPESDAPGITVMRRGRAKGNVAEFRGSVLQLSSPDPKSYAPQ